jgi:SPP1 gp7 family putative phage head morphogenesis protein
MEREYTRALKKIISALDGLTKKYLFPALPLILADAAKGKPTLDSEHYDGYADRVAQIMETMRKGFYGQFTDQEINSVADKAARAIAANNKIQLGRVFKSVIGVDLFQSEPWLSDEIKGFVVNNTELIKNVSEDYFKRVQNEVFTGARQGLRAEEIQKSIVETAEGVSESRAQLIARDQVNKFNGNLTELRQKSAGISRYIWRTSKDDRVRESHADKEGETFSWDDPPADTGHPGEDINCRCYAEPVIDDLLNEE